LRYGGKEFRLLLPNTGAVRALEIGETVRAAVRDLAMPHATSVHQTGSVGVACTKTERRPVAARPDRGAEAALYAVRHRDGQTWLCMDDG
jgi:diguanylate cyclase (GGDEF)-like protein